MKSAGITAVAIAGIFLACGSALAESRIVIKGSTTVLPVAQAAAEAYMKDNPGVNMSISGGGSGDGIKALIDKTRLANSSRDISRKRFHLPDRG